MTHTQFVEILKQRAQEFPGLETTKRLLTIFAGRRIDAVLIICLIRPYLEYCASDLPSGLQKALNDMLRVWAKHCTNLKHLRKVLDCQAFTKLLISFVAYAGEKPTDCNHPGQHGIIHKGYQY